MADDASNPDETPVTFNIKSSADAKYTVTVPLSSTVQELKQKLSGSDYADIPAERQRLIYSGRVLKDPDALASYKIKEGNTVHLVKSAASNQRQAQANVGAGSAAGTTSSGAPGGVPTNIAAGTGRDPLASLTGARYAGFAQMPNANLFGPDGGMGPPPDPEQMASMLENPAFSSQLNEALSNPDVVEQMIRSNPMLQGPMGQQARQMLRDPNFRRMMTDPETLRSMHQMRSQMPGMFGGMGGMGGGNEAFPMPGANEGGPPAAEGQQQQQQTEGGAANQHQQPNPFAAIFGGGAGAGGSGGTSGPAAPGNPFGWLFPPGAMTGAGPGQAPGQTQAQSTDTQNQPSTRSGSDRANPTVTSPPPQGPNPFQAAAQMFSQNPQLMTQMLSAMGGGGASGAQPSNTDSNSTNPSQEGPQNPQAGGMYNPFQALQMLQNMGFNPGAMGAGGNSGGNYPFGFPGAQQPQQPEDTRPPEERYADQLRQLNDMGFYEFERNVEALRRTGGSVQGAVEYLLSHT